MNLRRSLEALRLLLGIALVAHAALAGASDRRLTIHKGGPDTPPVGPTALAQLRDGHVAVLEAEDAELLLYDGELRLVGALDLPQQLRRARLISGPTGWRVVSLSGAASASLELDADGRLELRVRTTRSAGPPPENPWIGAGCASSFSRARNGDGNVSIKTARGALKLRIGAHENHIVAGGECLGSEGNSVWAMWEEIVVPSHSLDVRSFVGRFDMNGVLIEAGEVDLRRMADVPDRYLAVSNDSVLTLAGDIRRMSLEKVALSRDFETLDLDSSAEAEPVVVDPSADLEFQMQVRARSPGPIERSNPPPSRDRMLETAYAFLSLTWPYSSANYGRRSDERCGESAGSEWSRPARLRGLLPPPGRLQVAAVPYRWGGYASAERYLERIDQGYLAGDTCTCRDAKRAYCIVANATGLDCSGFVSQVWDVPYHTTSRLSAISNEIDWEELKPGDALNKPGAHVRLFVGFEDQEGLLLRVVESAKSCGGVCERTYRPSQLNGYHSIRLQGVD